MLVDIQFASTINKDYVFGAIKFLKSLKKFNPEFNFLYNFLVIDNALSEEEKKSIKSIYNNCKFIHIENRDYQYNNLSLKWRDWKYNCFHRFDIFLINCDKLIFFDLDFVCMGSLDELIKIDCEFGAVRGIRENIIDHPNENYFRGGLMVISKKYLNIQTRNNLIELSKEKLWSSDEPVLNTYFTNFTPLPLKFNILTSEYNDYSNSDIALLHYVGSKKPWFSNNLKENFDDYILKKQGIITLHKLQTLFNNK